MHKLLALLAAALPAAQAFLAPANGMMGLALRPAATAVRPGALRQHAAPAAASTSHARARHVHARGARWCASAEEGPSYGAGAVGQRA